MSTNLQDYRDLRDLLNHLLVEWSVDTDDTSLSKKTCFEGLTHQLPLTSYDFSRYLPTLDLLRDELQLRDARSKALALQSGFCRLPTEVIAHIFVIASFNGPHWLDGMSGAVASKISHVNRLFRSIALNTPTLWTNIQIDLHPMDEIQEWLNRSKACSINVSFDSRRGRTLPELVGSLIASHIHRVRSLKLHLHGNRWIAFFRGLDTSPKVLHQLECLTIWVTDSVVDIPPPHVALPVSWSVPNLRSFIGSGILPDRVTLAGLTRLKLHWCDSAPGRVAGVLPYLLELVPHLPTSLVELKFDFEAYDNEGEWNLGITPYGQGSGFEMVHLPHLRHLDIGARNLRTLSGLSCIASYLVTPELRTLRLYTGDCIQGSLHSPEIFERIGAESRPLRKLQRFDFQYWSPMEHIDRDRKAFDSMLSRLPALEFVSFNTHLVNDRTLRLLATGQGHDDGAREPLFPRLRTLRLIYCHNVTTSGVESLIKVSSGEGTPRLSTFLEKLILVSPTFATSEWLGRLKSTLGAALTVR